VVIADSVVDDSKEKPSQVKAEVEQYDDFRPSDE